MALAVLAHDLLLVDDAVAYAVLAVVAAEPGVAAKPHGLWVIGQNVCPQSYAFPR